MSIKNTRIVNFIEPTLSSETGHCFSFINSLCENKGDISFVLWVSKLSYIFLEYKNIKINKYFYRRFRKFQIFFLYQKLIKNNEKIFVSTASILDLYLINFAARGVLPSDMVFLYFHWMNNMAEKIPKLEKLAKLQPKITIICPTKSLVEFFKSVGFYNSHFIPYPIANKRVSNSSSHTVEFKSVLFAGAAREDKGFSKFVQLISHAHERKLSVPFTIQISSDHNGEHDSETTKNIALLKSIPYAYLNIYDETLSSDTYEKLFEGVICVQLYRSNDFADRVSGVTLDALVAGCPIITTEGTWIAKQVTRFGSGIVVDSSSPGCVHVAIIK